MVQYENWSWGWQLQIFLNVFAACFSVWAITKWKDSWKGFILAMIGAILATYSFANGILVWIVILLMIIFSKPKKKYFRTIWLMFFLLILISYLYKYEKPGHHPSLFSLLYDPFNFITFILIYIGSPFGMWLGLWASFAFGILGFSVFLIFIIYSILNNKHFIIRALPFLGMILYIILSALITSIGRSGIGAIQAASSRYTTFSIIFWIALLAILMHNYGFYSNFFKSSKLSKVFASFLCSIFAFSYISAYIKGSVLFQDHFSNLSRAHYILRYKTHYGDNSLVGLFPSTEELYTATNKLRLLKMGPFFSDIKESNGFYMKGSFIGETYAYRFNAYSKDDSLILEKGGMISFDIDIIDPGKYQLSAEIEFMRDHGIIIFKIDDTEIGQTDCGSIGFLSSKSQSKWIDYDIIFLSKGLHRITIKGHNNRNVIRNIAFRRNI
jgi:hypothetical protein